MSTADREPDESVEPPPTQEAGPDSAAAQTVLGAYDAFLDKLSPWLAPLEAQLRDGLAAHDAALAQLQSALEDDPQRPWPALAEYIAIVERSVVGALRAELARLDPAGEAVAHWNEAGTAAQPALAALSKKDRKALSPLVPFWRAVAAAIVRLEFGVTHWARATLDAASALDCDPLERDVLTAAVDPSAATAQHELDGEAVIAAGRQLHQQLQDAERLFATLPVTVRDDVAATATARQRQLDAAAAAGQTEEAGEDAVVSETDEQGRAIWSAWFDQARARVDLAGARLAAFTALAAMQTTLLRELDEHSVGAWRSAAGAARATIGAMRGRAEAIYSDLARTGDGRLAIRQAIELSREANRALYSDYVRRAEPAQVERVAAERTAAALALITSQADQLPEAFAVHAVPEDPEATVKPPVESRDVLLRAPAQAALQATLAPQLSAAAETLKTFATSMAGEIANAHAVLRFHLTAAVEELQEVAWFRGATAHRDQAIASARELTLAGLDRVNEALAQHQVQIDQCLHDLSRSLSGARHAVWRAVGSQVQAETATQQLALKTRTSFRASVESIRRNVSDAVTGFTKGSATFAVGLYGRIRGLLHYGKRAVSGQTTPSDSESAISAIARLGDIRASLPTVYRRLFSFYPLSDESLLAGRTQDMQWLRDQIGLWRKGRGNAYVLTSTPGCGLTSFINVAKQSCFRGAVVAEIDLVQRVTDEASLVELLCKELALDGIADSPTTLDALTDAILSREPTGQLAVGVVEHLGHLFMRRIGGMELLGRFLRFLSETDSRILWIATLNDFAWQLLTKNEPLALGLVTRYKISEYDRASLEDIIMRRHRRSGLPIRFQPPSVPSPFLRRRLRKAGSDEEMQTLLRAQYFDELHSAGGHNLMLGLFYWHLSIDYHADPASIEVRPLPKLNFDFLTSLSLPETFALKAFLEHATLTVDEYAQIATVDLDGSTEIFESLGNSLIIEMVTQDERSVAGMEFDRIERQARYRVRPLLIQPVIRYLRGKNIAH